jgi:hypothetical protein
VLKDSGNFLFTPMIYRALRMIDDPLSAPSRDLITMEANAAVGAIVRRDKARYGELLGGGRQSACGAA